MGRLVVEDVLLAAVGGMPLVGGARVRVLALEVFVVVVLPLSRFLFGLRLDPKEAPNCLNREFMRTSSSVTDPMEKRTLQCQGNQSMRTGGGDVKSFPPRTRGFSVWPECDGSSEWGVGRKLPCLGRCCQDSRVDHI